MAEPQPEFSRTLAAASADGRQCELEADETERAALARRFALVAIERLEGTLNLRTVERGIAATGTLDADIVTTCSVTAEEFPMQISAAIELRFETLPETQMPDEEIELDAEDCDVVFYTGSHIDLGEALAESLALELDPFPRGPHADTASEAAGLLSEEDIGPFAALKQLKDKL